MRCKFLTLSISITLILASCSPILRKGGGSASTQTAQSLRNPDCPLEFPHLPNLCAEISLAETSQSLRSWEKHTFYLKFWRKNQGTSHGPYLDPKLQPIVWLWMPMAEGSHGSPEDVDASPSLDASGDIEAGIYKLYPMLFSMLGDWEVHVELWDGNIKVDEVIEGVRVSH